MSRWFRFYAETLDDPKVQKLPPHTFKVWVNILCIASTNDGMLPSTDDLSFRLRMSTHDMQQQIDELIGLELIDIRKDKKLEPHNWVKRQFVSDTSTARVRKHRQFNKKQARNGSETLHGTAPDTDSDSETEQNRTEKGGSPPKFLREKLHEEFEAAFKARTA